VSRPRFAGATTGSLFVLVSLLTNRWALALATAVVMIVAVGVVLPAVWSSNTERRRAALAIFEVLWTGRRKRGNRR
jgi:hypothetical protein